MNNSRELEGRVALITGAARNIGRAIARELAHAGARVVINTRASVREAQAAAEALRANGLEAIVKVADVTDAAAVRRMVDEAAAKLGRLDILVNNAVAHGSITFDELCSTKGRYITGQTIHVNGGFYMNA